VKSLLGSTALASACAVLAVGCGKALPRQRGERGPGSVAAVGFQGAGGLSTRNITRLGGSSSAIDAAAVAVAMYPGLTSATRPRTVVLVDRQDWPGALAASLLAGSPLHAPLLYSEGKRLPPASEQALGVLRPTGAPQLDSTQVIQVGGAPAPNGYRTRAITARGSAELAVAIERLWSALHKHDPRQLIVTAADGPSAMTMPAAGLSAQTDTPILYVGRASIPSATRAELRRLGHLSIYVLGPSSVVGTTVTGQLERFGSVTRIAGADPASNSVAAARFTNGSFGWGVEEPGHGLAFASISRPFDAPAAALLSASGDYAPLLLLESPRQLPSVLESYLSDLQPGSPPSGPVHGVYNHGWVIGDEDAIATVTQARLDRILEISSQPATESPVASSTEESTPTAESPTPEESPTTSTEP
jgi:hypothetical protein